MKRQHREINIFNMSLLDILCGALGAFCFLMLVLFPFYKPSEARTGEDHGEKNIEQMEASMKEMERQLEKFRKIGPQASQEFVQKMQDQLERTQDQLGEARRRVDQAERDRDKTQAEIEQMRKRLDQLELRNPIGVQILWNSRHDVDLFVQQPFIVKATNKTAEFDPSKKQGPLFNGDSGTEVTSGPGSEVWILRDVPPAEYKVYYNLYDLKGDQSPVQVQGVYLYNSKMSLLPPVTLGPNRRHALIGSLVMDINAQLTFRPAQGAPPAPPRRTDPGNSGGSRPGTPPAGGQPLGGQW
ncbi:MAG: hypothetical protein KIT09_11510 [Bryobacteraceae bacterium]|nr:hypothetical protein [Bryobacteraceae bacterium]